MFKDKDLLVLYLSKNTIQSFLVSEKSTLKQIIIQSTDTYVLNEPNTIIHELPALIKTIEKNNWKFSLVTWIIDNPFIKSTLLSADQKLPVNDLTSAHSIYNRNNLIYCDSINQALLLQIRLISYRLKAYCFCPISRFFLLLSLYNNPLITIQNNANKDFSLENLEKVFNYINVKKTLPFQKNIDQENYHFYILVYGLLSIYGKK